MTRLGLPKFALVLPCLWLVPVALLVIAGCNDDTGVTETSSSTDTGDGDGDGDGDPGDGDTGPADCFEGQQQCTDTGHELCVDGTWESDPCPADTFCNESGDICSPCVCTPGEEGPCLDENNIGVCNDECSGWDASACTGAVCVVDTCADLICTVGAAYCTSDDTFHVCNGTGTDFETEQDCPGSQVCLGGECIDACLNAELTKSNVGCEFWALDMPNLPPRDAYTYAISIANPSDDDVVTVKIWDKRIGAQQVIIQDTVAPRESKVFNVSGSHAGYTSYYNGLDAGFTGNGIATGTAFRVETDIPVVATQFNPIGGASSISSDASLLLPTHALGNDYIHLSWALGWGTGSALNVIATENNTTITITPNVNTAAGSGGLPAMVANQPTQVVLDAYDYIQIGVIDQNVEDILQSTSGSKIESDKPVAVFGGHSCANVPDEVISGCDHIEEQIFPLETWGNNYVASRNPIRDAEPMRWRIIAANDDTVINFEPAIALGSQIILDGGDMIEFDEHQDFFVSADDPILVAGYMYGCASVTSPCIGDPYMVLMVPVEQYRDDYVFLVDDSYVQDFAKLVRPAGVEVTIDCLGGPVPEDRWTSIGTSPWEWATIDVNPGEGMCTPGTNQATSSQGFGVIVSGQSSFASYAYPGGLSLDQINPL